MSSSVVPSYNSGWYVPGHGKPKYPQLWKYCAIAMPIFLGRRPISGRLNFGDRRDITATAVNIDTYPWIQGLFSAQYVQTVDQYYNVGQQLNYTTHPFTIVMSVYIDSFDTNRAGVGPVYLFKGGYQAQGYYIGSGTTGTLNLNTNQAGANQTTSAPAGTMVTDKIHTFCITRSGANANIALDGRMVATTFGSHIDPTTSTYDFQIGRYGVAGSITNPNLKFFNLQVYSRAFTTEEMELVTSEVGIAYQLATRRKVKAVAGAAATNGNNLLLLGVG